MSLDITRRAFFGQAGLGVGSMALAALDRRPHFAARAKSVIFLFMRGGPSQLDLFDPKPKLAGMSGTDAPDELLRGQRFAFLRGVPKLLGSPHGFARHGGSGAAVSALLPHTAKIVDRLAFVRSVHTEPINHAPAQIFMNTGHRTLGRPSMGSWCAYGLGAESRTLPAFVVLVSGPQDAGAGSGCWSSGFLPSSLQGVELRTQGLGCVANPPGIDAAARRRSLDALADLNRAHLERTGDPEVAARIEAYEAAFRMQTGVPELADLSSEPRHVHELYGTEPGRASFANHCLVARRMVERGVRFVQLYHGGWDHHGTKPEEDLQQGLEARCREVDRASAALVADLDRRGLLDETLVVWGGEFGRTPMRQDGPFLGRDHQVRAFTMWMAGGGVKRGFSLGATGELGGDAVEDPVHVNDLHATILHLLGLDHERLVHRFQGRDHRLTDVGGRVVRKLLA